MKIIVAGVTAALLILPANAQSAREWFSYDTSKSMCFASRSPADEITLLREAQHSDVHTRDFGDSSDPTKVAVIYTRGTQIVTYTFWRSKAQCEAELPRNLPIPDRYR